MNIQPVVGNSTFLKNTDPAFWFSCFVRLFPRGDCAERCGERLAPLSRARWVKCLLTRADAPQWRTDVEFVATLYNVLLRRDQMHAVEASFRSPHLSTANLEDMGKLTAESLVALALSSGDANSVKDVLRRKNLEKNNSRYFSAHAACPAQCARLRGREGQLAPEVPGYADLVRLLLAVLHFESARHMKSADHFNFTGRHRVQE